MKIKQQTEPKLKVPNESASNFLSVQHSQGDLTRTTKGMVKHLASAIEEIYPPDNRNYYLPPHLNSSQLYYILDKDLIRFLVRNARIGK